MPTVPSLIEYLMALRRPSGGKILGIERDQFTIPYFPPNAFVSFDTRPPPGSFAAIGYQIALTSFPPNVFHILLQLYGQRPYDGIVMEDIVREPFQVFYVLTDAMPMFTRIQNVSAIAHVWQQGVSYLTVATTDDLLIVHKAIDGYGGAETERILRSIEDLLTPTPEGGGA